MLRKSNKHVTLRKFYNNKKKLIYFIAHYLHKQLAGIRFVTFARLDE